MILAGIVQSELLFPIDEPIESMDEKMPKLFGRNSVSTPLLAK